MATQISKHSKPGFLHIWTGSYEVSVQRLERPTGVVYLADTRVQGSNDPKIQTIHADIRSALRAIGYPVDVLGVPSQFMDDVSASLTD